MGRNSTQGGPLKEIWLYRRKKGVEMKRLIGVFLVTAGVVSATLVGEGVAQATPTNCQKGYAGSYAGWAWCTGGTGDFRARVNCRHNEQPNTYYRYGPWIRTGPQAPTSVADCNSGDLASGVIVQTREPCPSCRTMSTREES
jgi:hypothetical protein